MQEIRDFFNEKDYLEVETPVLSPTVIPEAPIELFKTSLLRPDMKEKAFYLLPSPELYMKKLLAKGWGNIFQFSRCFRNYESLGKIHSPEFTMLEWYSVKQNYIHSLELTIELWHRCHEIVYPGHLQKQFEIMTMEEAFLTYAGFSLQKNYDLDSLKEEAKKEGLSITRDDTWEVTFNKILLTKIEPNLPQDRPVILKDYPAAISCLAKDIPGTPWKERWELYINGIEIANCYSEETEPEKIETFFETELEQQKLILAPADEEFKVLFREGNYPESSGVALGVDRLVMVLLGAKTLEGVMLFPLSDKIAP